MVPALFHNTAKSIYPAIHSSERFYLFNARNCFIKDDRAFTVGYHLAFTGFVRDSSPKVPDKKVIDNSDE
jgi:hypothetical protein